MTWMGGRERRERHNRGRKKGGDSWEDICRSAAAAAQAVRQGGRRRKAIGISLLRTGVDVR